MKSFIIYVKDHKKSEEYAQECLESCEGKFDAELFEGVTPESLEFYDEKYNFEPMYNSRALTWANSEEDLIRYRTKKSLWINGFRLWQKCVELDEPICVLEHDAQCIRAWDEINFDELLILNINSAFSQRIVQKICINSKIMTESRTK
jgi:hypothetical protein